MRSRLARIAGRQPVCVFAALGDSQTTGIRNSLADFPLRSGSAPYYPQDGSAFLWDRQGGAGAANRIIPFVAGPLESQPNGPDTTSGFTNTVGWGGEFLRWWRAAKPTDPVYFFIHQEGGGRFSDAASRGRAANWTPSLTDGAFAACESSWKAFTAALAAQGKYPVVVGAYLSMGANNCQDATETTNFESDMGAWETALRNRLFGDKPKFFYNYLQQLGALSGFSANVTSIRTAFRNLVTADPSRRELMNFDGMTPVTFDNLHYDAASFQEIGEKLAFHALGWWYPLKEWTFSGGNQAVHLYRPGALINQPVQTALTGGTVTTALDLAGGGYAMTQGTSTKRPVEGEVTLSSGAFARNAASDGTDDILVKSGGSGDIGARSFGWFSVASGAAVSGKNMYGEGGETINPFIAIQSSNVSGDLGVLLRDDAGTVIGPSALKSGAFNGTRNALAVYGTVTSITGWVNGTAGTALNVTRGTMTLTRTAMFGLSYNAGAELNMMAVTISELFTTTAVPDATYLTNYQTYCQRRWGTP